MAKKEAQDKRVDQAQRVQTQNSAKKNNSKKNNKEIIKRDIILAYALENALAHEGRAQGGAVIPKLFQAGLKKEQIKDVIKDVNETITKVNLMKKEEQETEFA